ncbi:hypothetical protein PInf_010953 [Phytophthora infestans]|nr:hypothetical protein PInf_010953 [Phytophthora infestans]
MTVSAIEKTAAMAPTTDTEDEEVPSEGEGALRRKSLLSKASGSPTKVYPGLEHTALETKASKYTKSEMQSNSNITPRTNHDSNPVLLPNMLAVVVLACLCWTLWLILLNIAPNDTVNHVMDTSTFDYGSFWLMVDPPMSLMIAATLGLVMVAVGYLGVLIKLIPSRRSSKQAYLVHQVPDTDAFMKKVERALDDAATRPQSGKITSTIVNFAAARKKNGQIIGEVWGLALETFLLYQLVPQRCL